MSRKRLQSHQSPRAGPSETGPPDTRPTVRTVAALAGVSIASASRVLNGLGGSAQTTARVRAAAEEVGYVPNAIARSLQAQRTGLLALAVEDIGNPVYVAMMRAIEAVVAESGRQLLVHATRGDPTTETTLLRGLARRYVDGMIISPIRLTDAHLEALTTSAVPVVVVGQLPDDVPIDNVRADSRAGVALAVDHLVASGRVRIGFLNGPLDTVPGAARAAGYQAALDRHGLTVHKAHMEVARGFGYADGRAAAEQMLHRGQRLHSGQPDAILCANDLIAVGALHALLAAGVRVPEDVALVGMDDTELAQMSFPQLSSVSLGSAIRGRRAAELLLERINDPSLPPRRESVAPHLVVRASSP